MMQLPVRLDAAVGGLVDGARLVRSGDWDSEAADDSGRTDMRSRMEMSDVC